jgi:4-amino-4-deoxy-L-arabinose transferase-like glycosyltransferase
MVIAALAIRLIVMAFTYTAFLDPALDHKAFGYETGRVARSIATGQGFSSPYGEPTGPTALIPPAYTYLLAGIFKLFGVYTTASALVILALNNLFSALTCAPLFLIARRVFGPPVAAWAGWIWALFPYAITLPNITIWETTLTTLLLTLLVLATLHLDHSTSVTAWLGYGLLWGIAALSSPTSISTLPFLGAWIWLRHWRRGGNCTGPAIAAALIFFATVGPWIWRCSQTYGHFVPFRSGFGLDFRVGNSDDTRTPSNWNVLPADNPDELRKLKLVGEPAYMAQKQREASEFIANHPGRFARQTLRRILFTWTGLWDFPPSWTLADSGLPNVITYTLCSFLAFFGIVASIRESRDALIPLLIPLIFIPLAYYITHADIRFRHPADPEVVIFLAYGVVVLLRKKTKNNDTRGQLGAPQENL